MISNKTLNLDWINFVSSKNRNVDKILIEKVIRAVFLLEGLAESGLDFIFKGGTSLMLMQGSTRRLSIDIDIIIQNKIDLKQLMEKILRTKNFTRLEHHERNVESSIEKAHYKFHYLPVYRTALAEDSVLLDILYEKSQYQKMKIIDIDSPFVRQEGKALKINVPSFEDLLGDKLTAFAPNTTGIPYEKNGHSQSMEIIKQLYDIGNLFDASEDIEIVRDTFEQFALTELSYRNLSQNTIKVLEDIFETALCISTRGLEGNGDFKALQDGISKVRAYIFSETFQIEKAIICASKAAYLTKLIEFNESDQERFENALQIGDWIIEQPFCTRLNNLKKSNPEAFFYWYKTYRLRRKS